jgi:UPF0755 protein
MRSVFIVFAIIVLVAIIISAPTNFPINQPVVIERGLSDMQVATTLKDAGVIRFSTLFYAGAKITGVSHQLKAGRYMFASSTNMLGVLDRVAKGKFGTHVQKVTVPEGFTNDQISELVGIEMGSESQGYLFPDTYFLDQYSSKDEIREIMISNFYNKVGDVATDTVILASILEEEVQTKEDMKLVAGILLKRLKAGMALQVDSYPDSYKFKGLPLSPISNPGLVAIDAARNPENSKYWYYVSGKDGTTHYAKTFDEHRVNIVKYLK